MRVKGIKYTWTLKSIHFAAFGGGGREGNRDGEIKINQRQSCLFTRSFPPPPTFFWVKGLSIINKSMDCWGKTKKKKKKKQFLSPAVLKISSGSCALLPAERLKTRCVNTRLRCFDLLGFPPFFFIWPKRVTFRWKSSVRKETWKNDILDFRKNGYSGGVVCGCGNISLEKIKGVA